MSAGVAPASICPGSTSEVSIRRGFMLKGKSAIVTGSTSGIGLGIAVALAGEGWALMLNGFGDPGEIDRLRADLVAEHGVAVAYSPADVSKPAQIRELVAEAVRRFGSVDILVNNA